MSLTKKVAKSVKWSSTSQFGRQIIQYLTTLILVNLLKPSDFGLMAMALVVIGFLELFKDLGTGSAIIQSESINHNFLSSIFWLNIMLGVLIFLLIFISSPLISVFYNNIKINLILKILSIGFLITSFSNVSRALLEKEISFAKLAKIELISSLLGSVIGIFLAFKGFGVWSLVCQSLTNSLSFTIIVLLKSKWKPGLIFKINEIKLISGYSLNLVGFNFFNFFARNADYLLIAKFLGDTSLGHYYLIYKIMLYPVQTLSQVISRVIFPLYSKFQNNNEKIRIGFEYVVNSIALISFPLMLGLAAVSKAFINSFFGQNWNSELLITLLIILAPVGLIQSISSNVGSIYQAKGRTDLFFKWGVFSSIIFISGFIIGLRWGVEGIAISYLITNILLFYPVFAIPLRLIDFKFFSLVSNLYRPMISSFTMLIFVMLFIYLFSRDLESISLLLLSILIGVITYSTASIIFNKEKILVFKNLLLYNKLKI